MTITGSGAEEGEETGDADARRTQGVEPPGRFARQHVANFVRHIHWVKLYHNATKDDPRNQGDRLLSHQQNFNNRQLLLQGLHTGMAARLCDDTYALANGERDVRSLHNLDFLAVHIELDGDL